VVERHFLEQPERCAKLSIDWSSGVVVQHLLREDIA
jgi:hypothetical protein